MTRSPRLATDQGRDPREPRPAPPPRPSGVRSVLARLPIGSQGVPVELQGLAARIRASSPRVDLREVVRAYAYAADAHEGQYRKSGEAYITHPVAVATKLADLGLDTDTIVASLLHDVVEDTDVTRADVAEHFGEEVARLVDGVTKLDQLEVASKQHQQAETLRKMILAMAEDIRVLVIKLCDRWHNMETLGAMPREKQKRIAQETLDIYAPLAHRLGMQHLKLDLEDLGFGALHPKRHAEIVAMVEERTPERDAYINKVVAQLQERCREIRVRADIAGRPKHYYSIYEKMVLRGKEFDEIHDLIGIRILVDTVRDCYAVLGQVHSGWRPIQGRFKDYIAMPKSNFYQSLHTSVVGPEGRPLEIQIRTHEMHQTAEYGVAAHWKYKEEHRGREGGASELDWVQRLAEWQQDTDLDDPSEYLDALKIDLYQDEVFVFTPNGDVVALPKGATPIDFAYTIHTDVGHRCIGARVNGRLIPLDQPLANGVTVEIMTSKAEDAGPSRDWLKIAKSQRARSKIRAWFNKERREDAHERGRESVLRALRKEGLSLGRVAASGELAEVAGELSYTSVDALLRAVGEGHVKGPVVAKAIVSKVLDEDEVDTGNLFDDIRQAPIRIRPGTGSGVSIEGDKDMMVSIASCCGAVPGDQIAGFVTRGRGVSVHRRDCPNMADLARQQPERILAVDWTGERAAKAYEVTTQVEAFDRHHLLRDITSVLGDLRVSITSAQVSTRRDRVAVLRFSFEMGDPEHLDYVLRSIRKVDGVYDAYRVTPGGGAEGDAAVVDAALESALERVAQEGSDADADDQADEGADVAAEVEATAPTD